MATQFKTTLGLKNRRTRNQKPGEPIPFNGAKVHGHRKSDDSQPMGSASVSSKIELPITIKNQTQLFKAISNQFSYTFSNN